MIEEWRDVPKYEGHYQVSNLGRVKSLDRRAKNRSGTRFVPGILLSQTITRKGYNRVYLSKGGIVKPTEVQIIVAWSFLNYKTKNGLVVDHIDNNPLNNNLTNLQLVTIRYNSSKDKKGVSSYTGVCWSKKVSKWQATIKEGRKSIWLGYHSSELEASNAYQKELKRIISNNK